MDPYTTTNVAVTLGVAGVAVVGAPALAVGAGAVAVAGAGAYAIVKLANALAEKQTPDQGESSRALPPQ